MKLNEKFTNGPWTVLESNRSNLIHIESSMDARQAGIQIATVNAGSKDQRLINARLIASAPEMYEALQEVRMYLSSWLQQNGCLVSENKTYQKIDEAIKKARGES